MVSKMRKFRMSATQDLRSCLLSLCEIIENILPNLQKGIISPELFRLAKQDDQEAIKVKIFVVVHGGHANYKSYDIYFFSQWQCYVII